MFFPRSSELQKEFNQFTSIVDAFKIVISGFKTHRDHFAVAIEKEEIKARLNLLRDRSVQDTYIKEKYSLC